MSTLDDLKRAIDDYRAADTSMYSSTDLQARKAHAWRTAFKWRDEYGGPPSNCDCKHCRKDRAEYDEAMKLIREKLS